MSKIQQGLQGVSQSAMSRLKGVKGVSYNPTTIQVDTTAGSKAKQLSASFDKFLGVATKGASYYADKREASAQQNVKKIMSSMSPEQVAAARANGTILAQDDPFTVAALNKSLGAMESDTVYTELSRRMNAGEFKTREDFSKALAERSKQANQDMADAYGVSPHDEDWQAGWGDAVEAKNIALYKQFDGIADKQAQNTAMMANTASINSAISDKSADTPTKVAAVMASIQLGQHAGTIRSADQVNALVGTAVSAALVQPNAAELLTTLGDQKINVYGKDMTIKEMMGQEQWSLSTAKAEQAVFSQNWEARKSFMGAVDRIENNEDLIMAQNDLNQEMSKLEGMQPSDKTTSQKEELMRLQAKLNSRKVLEAKAIKAKTLTAQQGAARQEVLEDAYRRKLAGEIVSTDTSTFATNEATGKYSPEDVANFAHQKFSDIAANPNMTDDQKIERQLQYVIASPEGSPFRKIFSENVTEAVGEWNAAILDPTREGDLSKMNKFIDIYANNKSVMNQLYPELTEPMIQMEAMAKYGLTKDALLNQARLKKEHASPEARREMDVNWSKLVTDNSKWAELSYMPEGLRSVSRAIYDSVIYTGGDSAAAGNAVGKFLKENMVNFGDNTDASGLIPKSALMVDGDPKSWERSSSILKADLKAFTDANPHIPAGFITTELVGKNIRVTDPTGTINRVYTQQDFKAAIDKENQDLADKAEKERKDALTEIKRVQEVKQKTPKSVWSDSRTEQFPSFY